MLARTYVLGARGHACRGTLVRAAVRSDAGVGARHTNRVLRAHASTATASGDKYEQYEAVIGIEVHAQLKSQTKLFSPARAIFAEAANSQVHLHDAAIPGTLPLLNAECVKLAVRAGLAFGSTINLRSCFDRKHYFYADLPQGYQITQQYHPLVSDGKLALENGKDVRILRMHLEQDSGKSMHGAVPGLSLIDLNRCGTALVEIVSHPDMRSSEEAALYVRTLQNILFHTGVCDANMEEGSMRCDVNVSVRKRGEQEFGTRCEVKNVNGVRFVRKAIEFELRRHVDLLEAGIRVDQETRSFDASRSITVPLRTKEMEVDYRYMPDPDLPPLVITEDFVRAIRDDLPELPTEKADRYVRELKLKRETALAIVSERYASDYFEKVLELGPDPVLAANWISNELLGHVHADIVGSLRECAVSEEQLASVLHMLQTKEISGKIAKQILAEMYERGDRRGLAQEIASAKGWALVTDSAQIRALCQQVMEEHQEQVCALLAPFTLACRSDA
eukprot:TRINITY_DN8443_c0_g1_i2.p1 TRINITY_DN8443_c0_g1~~TRINITY_DN8443_c0_g1_i2.p1  ORF type:complete len:505 (-),score=103.94 TRINITY_DN8443_c0_g1_i2:89-1603(-)